MINLLLGAPGGGKTYEAVAYHILPALAKGRKVITNLPLQVDKFAEIDPSFPALIEIRVRPQLVLGIFDLSDPELPAFRVGEEPEIAPAGQRVFGGVWDYFSTWRDPVKGYGPLFVIDECHECLPRMKSDKQVQEWYARHRHFNVDVLLMTQSYGKIDESIRDLVQIVYRVRKNVALGSTSTYTRKVQDGIRGAVVNTSQRVYQARYFPLYKSHTQGESVAEFNASDVRPMWRSPMFIATYLLLGVPIILWVTGILPTPWSVIQKAKAAPEPKGVVFAKPAPVVAPITKAIESPYEKSVSAKAADAPVKVEKPEDVDPLESKGVHLIGYMKLGSREVYRFMISSNAQAVFETDDVQLRRTGYTWKPAGECFGWLTYGHKSRAVVCDGPTLGANLGGSPNGNTQPGGSIKSSPSVPAVPVGRSIVAAK